MALPEPAGLVELGSVDAPFTQTSVGWNVILGGAFEVAGFTGFFMVCLLAIGSLLYLLVACRDALEVVP